MKRIVLLSCLLFLTISASSALAHKIRVFAYSEGDTIYGETGFSGGRQPKNVEIIVLNAADGKTLLTTTTDEVGKFAFPIPETAKTNRLDLRITVDGGDGHSNFWMMEAADYLPGSPQVASSVPAAQSQPPSAKHEVVQDPACGDINPESLQVIIEESVARQLAPVKHMLAKSSERKLSLQDILGGIGYIFGLAGLAAYLQAKKGEKK